MQHTHYRTHRNRLQLVASGDADDVVQCFRCQGFWHRASRCRQTARCVRCGENHEIAQCRRARTAVACCNCGGSHHAAHRLCPVRLRHLDSAYVSFRLAARPPWPTTGRRRRHLRLLHRCSSPTCRTNGNGDDSDLTLPLNRDHDRSLVPINFQSTTTTTSRHQLR